MSDIPGAIVTAAAGLLGVGLGGGLALLSQRRQRADERLQKQLDEFYAPFLGIRMLILAKSEFRVKLSGKLGAAWPRLFTNARAQGDPSLLKETADKHWPAFEKAQDYTEHVLKHEIVPLYNKMVQLFIDKMPFTEPSTRQYFGELVEFVEIWNRFFADALPKEPLGLLDHREDKVKPLYAEVADQVENLTRQLSSQRANVRRGLHRLAVVLVCGWLLAASAYIWSTKLAPTFVCTDSPSQGVSRLPPNTQPSPNGVRVQGPDGQTYFFPDGTTKPDAISYFKRRCTRETATPRNILSLAVMPAVIGICCYWPSGLLAHGFGAGYGRSVKSNRRLETLSTFPKNDFGWQVSAGRTGNPEPRGTDRSFSGASRVYGSLKNTFRARRYSSSSSGFTTEAIQSRIMGKRNSLFSIASVMSLCASSGSTSRK